MSNQEQIDKVKKFRIEKIDAVSKTFCAAKWAQSTILLFNGETHSCHHPHRHKIDASSLTKPSALHNTPIKIKARQELLDGIQTKECDYCWNIENIDKDLISDRIIKTSAPWATSIYDDILASGTGENFRPSYLEVAFDYTCNLACMYCTPDVSSKWMEDVSVNGPYKFSNSHPLHDIEYIKQIGKMPIKSSEFNPYIDAFWKWWPELWTSLKVFRITGGEPLLSKHTWTIFDWFKTNVNKNLELSINTNLCVPDKLIDRLIENIKEVSGNVKEIKIFTSIEATGSHAEYIRDGLNYKEWLANVDRIMQELPDVRIVISTTLNCLSIFTIKNLLEEIHLLRKKYTKDIGNSKIGISFNYLRWPHFMDVRLFGKKESNQLLFDALYYMQNNRADENGHFYLEDIATFLRFVEFAMSDIVDRDSKLVQFREFFEQYDKRRNLSLTDTFGDLTHYLA